MILKFLHIFIHYVVVTISLVKTVSSLLHYYLSLHWQYNLKLWSVCFTDAEKESLHAAKGTAAEQRKTVRENSSEEEVELSPKNERVNNGHGAEAKIINRRSFSDDSNNSRFLCLVAFVSYIYRVNLP